MVIIKKINHKITESRTLTDKDRKNALRVPIHIFLEAEGVNILPRGERWICKSPLTNENEPSFYIYPENRYYCFSSGTGGDIISLVRLMKGLGYFDSVKFLLNFSNQENFDENKFVENNSFRKKSYGKFDIKAYKLLVESKQEKVIKYAESRGFSRESYIPSVYKEPISIGEHVKFIDVLGVGFPHTNHYGNICGIKMRKVDSLEQFPRFSQRGKAGFYVLENFINKKKKPRVYIVESETSAAAFYTFAKDTEINCIIISFGGINQVPNSLPFKWEYLDDRILIIDFDGDEKLWKKRIDNFKHLNAMSLKIKTEKGIDLANLSLSGEIKMYL